MMALSGVQHLNIRQTFLSIHVIMKNGGSRSISVSLDRIFGETQLTYCYLNEPRTEFRDNRSEIHYDIQDPAI